MSGKGGVGKSSVAACLAVALAQKGYRIGLMDVDLHGPSIARLLMRRHLPKWSMSSWPQRNPMEMIRYAPTDTPSIGNRLASTGGIMDAATYDRWYETPRGRWIGQREVSLVLDCLQPRPGESVLDVGCGTGYFTRAIAESIDGKMVAVDIKPEWVAYARGRDAGRSSYTVADARSLPYPDGSFDLVVSIAALCFIKDEIVAAREILRVARRRFAIGLLNRQSLLWLQKGRNMGVGGYRGAHWHTVNEAKHLFRNLPLQRLWVRSAIQVPSGGRFARSIEQLWPTSLLSGAFILVYGDVATCDEVS